MVNRRSDRKPANILRVRPRKAADVTEYRKAELSRSVEDGTVIEGTSYQGSRLNRSNTPTTNAPPDSDGLHRGTWLRSGEGSDVRRKVTVVNGGVSQTAVGAVAHSDTYMKTAAAEAARELHKTAASVGSVGGTAGTSSGSNVERLAPEVYSPLFTMANLNLPRDRITINAWVRNFFLLHPIVRNAITLHATYPISKLNLKCQDKRVLQFHEDMIEEMDLMGALGDISLEYWKLGEKIQGSSLVTMADGTLKAISEIQVGDYVMTHLGRTKKVLQRFAKPTDTVIEEHLKIYKVHVVGVPEPLIISGRHPMLSTPIEQLMCNTPSCKKRKVRVLPRRLKCSNCGKIHSRDLVPQFIEAAHVHKNDVVYAPFNSNVVENTSFSKPLCYLIGYWLAEGCYCKAKRKKYTKYNGIKFCSYDELFINDNLIPLLKECTGHKGNTYISKSTQFAAGKNKYDHFLEGEKRGGPQLANFFKTHCGEYSKEKKLSEAIMLLPTDLQKHIIAGFIDGDGCVDNSNGHIIICTSSKDLANQFALMLRRLGAHPTISKVPAKQNIADRYRVKVVANEAFDLFNDCLKTEKRKLSLRKTRWCSPNSSIYQNWQMLSIKKIEDITHEFNENFMYDLEVEDDHSYIANGLAIHNCFPYAELNEENGKWVKIVVQNPDYIHVKKTVLSGDPIISLKPDAVLQRLVMSNNPADMQLRRQIPEKIIYHVRANQDIPLDNFNVSHLKLLSSPYDVRGTSIIVSAFKDLMLYDKIRESKFAQADSMINPITLIKVGGNTDGDYRATQEDLEFFREIFEEAEYDKNFKLITHAGVDVQRVGFNGQVLDIAGDMELIIKNIYTGLMVPPAVVDTESAVYASASIGLEVLRQRYFNFRNMMAKWLVNKIFAPISEIQGFYEYKNKEKRLIVPEVEWNHMNLYDLQDYISNVTGMVSSKQASVQTLYRSMGLNYEDEKVKMRQESIDEAIRRREEMALGTMTLTELRSLDPEKPIMEAIDSQDREAEPAIPPEAGMPAGMPGAELGAGPMGGLPELAPPPGTELPGAPGAPGVPGAPPAPGGGVTPGLGPGTPGGPGGGV